MGAKQVKSVLLKSKYIFFLGITFLTLCSFLNFSAVKAFADVTIDNGDPGTSYTGKWYVSGGLEPYGGDSLWARGGDTYTWSFDGQPPGDYEVLMWWSGSPSRATAIGVDIYHSGGNATVIINQNENAGKWYSLGTYYFDSSGQVTITAAFGSNVSTCADAVWFKSLSYDGRPTADIDSISPNPAEVGQTIDFLGHGTDTGGPIVAYEWVSSINGLLSNAASFSTSSLDEGTHIISFRVQDNEELWSEAITQTLRVESIPTEVIIDNRDSQTLKAGTWSVSGGTDPYSVDSLWARDGATFTWQFNPPQGGNYEISMCWSAWPSRGTDISVDINSHTGNTKLSINQQEDSGKWNSLGTYYFESSGSVTITAAYGSTVSTCADAVKFTLVQSNVPPRAIIDSILPNPADIEDQIHFSGHGEDLDGSVVAYEWLSSLQGPLSDQASFTVAGSSLGEGVHTISFRVMDDMGGWSTTSTNTLAIGNLPPLAIIDSIAPNPAEEGEEVLFAGHGEDNDGSVNAYTWHSSIDGTLSNDASFSTSSLSSGSHTITFTVFDDDGAISAPVEQVLVVQDITTVEKIIDNGGVDTSQTGTWSISSGSYPYGSDSLWSRDGATYTWSFSPPVTGYYEAFMWWTEWPSRSSSVPVEVNHYDGKTEVYTNQQEDAGKWNSLGIYYFTSGAAYNVTITAQPGPASTCADAVKFVKTSQASLPVADFSADKTSGGAPLTIQFSDRSVGTITGWFWSFGDGQQSSERNPSHRYTAPGTYTVSLTVSNLVGSNTKTRSGYIEISSPGENIYLFDGYIMTADFVPLTINMLQGLGATQENGVWVYTNYDKNKTYYIQIMNTPEAMQQALKEEGAHLIFNGHANFGSGAVFATPDEVRRQIIEDVYFVDDERFVNLSTDMVSLKISGMKYGQAYPNWEPVLTDGTSALMPYDFSEGLPPYNYYLTYTIPGDSTTYRIELADGSYLERIPDASTPAWFSPDGSLPDPAGNPEYFITNSDQDFNRCDFMGNWPYSKEGGGYQEYNYQYHAPGTGSNTATWNLVVKYPGYYSAVATWVADPANASNAKYTIQHANGSSTVMVDQRTTGGINELGTYFFDEDNYTIRLDDNADGRVIADTVSLLPLNNPNKILQAEFRANVTSGPAPLSVQFVDLSQYYDSSDGAEGITDWYWDFGDNSTSTLQNPIHTYPIPGIYTVRLRVRDSSVVEDTEVKTDFIVVGTTPTVQAEFTSLKRMALDRAVVNFVDQSSGDISSWLWDFGDGYQSNERNPTHFYSAPGVYTVTLTVSGPDGTDNEVETDFVNVLVASVYADNLFHHKPHFYERRIGRYRAPAKVVLDTGGVNVKKEDLKYSRIFYGSCNSCNYFAGTLQRGIMFCTTEYYDPYTSIPYLRYYLQGYSDEEILERLNNIEPMHEMINFDMKPPSLR